VSLEAAGERDVTEGVQVSVKVTTRAVAHNLSIRRTNQHQFVIDLVVPGYRISRSVTFAGEEQTYRRVASPDWY